jgi:phosphohistidine phosphatase
MRLYFFRHAEAEDAANGVADHERALTSKGQRRTALAAQGLVRLKVKPVRLYSSPRVRSRQTADILAESLGLSVEVRDEVDFDFSVLAVERLIADLEDESDVLFVGHEPSMSIILSDMTGANVAMKKGGMARVDIAPTTSPLRGRLVWLLAPRVFDTLGA